MKLTDNLYFYPESGMLDANTYIIRDSTGIIVDPGAAKKIPWLVSSMAKDGIKPAEIGYIINTHLHLDHYEGDQSFKKISGARILVHTKQKEFYNLSVVKVAQFFGMLAAEFKADENLDETELKKGSLQLECIFSPGHSADSVCLYSKPGKFLICGDVLFNENTGRVDLPGGNAATLKQSIEELAKLDIEYLLPGHMNVVIGADAVKQNFQYIRDNVFGWL